MGTAACGGTVATGAAATGTGTAVSTREGYSADPGRPVPPGTGGRGMSAIVARVPGAIIAGRAAGAAAGGGTTAAAGGTAVSSAVAGASPSVTRVRANWPVAKYVISMRLP